VSCFSLQDGVVIPADNAGDTGVGQLFADSETVADVLADGAAPAWRVPASQLCVRHSQ